MGIVNTYFEQIREIRDSNLREESLKDLVKQEHLAIVDALMRRNKVAVSQAVEYHMDQIWMRWRKRNQLEEN